MDSKKYTWGIMILVIGVLLLLNNFNFVSFQINWSMLGSMWPLILIIVGLSSLSRNTQINPWIFNGLIAIVFSIFIYQIVDFSGTYPRKDFEFGEHSEVDSTNQNKQFFSLPIDSGANNVRLQFQGAAAQFIIQDTTSELITAETSTFNGEYSLTKNTVDSNDNVRMRLNKTKFQYKNGNWNNEVIMKLNPTRLWTFDFEVGAGAVEFDLRPYNVKKLNMDAGAAAINLKLGNINPETNVDISAGASDIDISIPSDARCRINIDAILSSKNLDGFVNISDGIYETANYKSGKGNVINIKLDAGMSDVSITRY
jgi:Domain of unknown function (DUF5668)